VTAKLVFENLKHKPMRSLLSFLLIGVPVTLILTLVGLAHGMLEDSQNRARGVGADLVVRGSGTTSVTNLGPPAVREGYVKFLATEVPHVTMAIGVVNQLVDFPVVMTGIEQEQFDRMSGGFEYVAGHPLRGPDDILVDRLYAAQKNLRVGQTLSLINHNWHVVGIIEGGKLARLVVQIKTLQHLDSIVGEVSQIWVKLDNPANDDAVVKDIESRTDLKVNTMEEFTEMFSVSNIHGVTEFIYVIMAIGVVIGFVTVCLSMYMSVLQRTREIGILKSLGASKTFILRIILVEAVVLGIGGTVIGILMSYGAWWLIRTFVPASLPMIIMYSWWPIAGAITLVGALLGALYPGLSAARHDPIEALAYE
jgi:putative ABC transport system permease protein